ncbi:DUF6694 family lipoprotein [Vibrio owensii]|uniref:DUF6694 family lipoprotein n=1 Tax=Vibrio owensii TaxID=696485 RepID=UPI003D9FF39A
MNKFTFAALLCCTLAGCGKPSLDTTSEDAFVESYHKVLEDLPTEKQQDFKVLIKALFINSSLKGSTDSLKEELDGLTGEEVFELAETKHNERLEERKK